MFFLIPSLKSISPRDIIKKALQDSFSLSGQTFCSDREKCHRHRAASGVLAQESEHSQLENIFQVLTKVFWGIQHILSAKFTSEFLVAFEN